MNAMNFNVNILFNNLDLKRLTNFCNPINISNKLEQLQKLSYTLLTEEVIIILDSETDVDMLLKLSTLYLENETFKSILESESI